MSGRILIVDDVPTNRALLKAKLSAAYFDITTVSNGPSIPALAIEHQPDLILIDLTMPDRCGYQLCRDLKSSPQTFHIPVVMITAAEKTEQRVEGLKAGADDFLSKPFDDCTLIARVRNLMRLKIMFDEMHLRDDTSRELGLDSFLRDASSLDNVAGTILIAGPDAAAAKNWTETLSQIPTFSVYQASDEAETMGQAKVLGPDLLIVHQNQSDGSSGISVLAALRTAKNTRQAAIIFVVEQGQEELAASALDLGATDYLVTPFEPNELMVRVRSQLRRKQYSDRLRSNVVDGLKMAVIDPLTGLYNRRYAFQHLNGISERAATEGQPFSILMMDLDEFKSVNDLYGHPSGDEVLCEFSRRLQENLRGIDLVSRIGGEEFLVAMPGTDQDQAAIVAERLRMAIETKPFLLSDFNDQVSVTVSIGVAASNPIETNPSLIMKNADTALYLAKNDGRNAVKIFCDAA